MGIKKQLNKSIILHASAELIEEKGYENLTLNQLAEKLGIKTPSLYNHLSGAGELSAELSKFAIQKLEEAGRDAAVGKSKTDALKAIAGAYRKFAKENPQLYKAVLRYHSFDDDGIRESGHALVRVLYRVMEPYYYSEEDTIHFVRGFRSALHGFVSLEEAGFFKAVPNADKSFDRLVLALIFTLNSQENL